MTNTAELDLRAARGNEWRAHWKLALACTVGFSFYSVVVNAIGLFLEPLSNEFGWSRTEIMAGLSLLAIAGVVLSPFVGALIDRYGSRRIALPGLVLTALSIVSFSFANGSTLQWTLLWVFLAFSVLLIKTTVWTTAISGTFNAARSMAIAVAMSGTAVSQAVVPPLTHWLIAELGWRSAYVALGLGWGAVAFVLSLFFLYDAHDRRMAIDVSIKDKEKVSRVAQEIPGLSLKEAFCNPALIRIGISTFIVMLMGIGISVNQVPIIMESGISRERAAIFASFFGVAGIFGKLVTGWLMDRYNPGVVGGVTLAVSGLAFLLLLERFNDPVLIVSGLVMIGYAGGTKLQICAYLTSLYSGMRNYGKIFGIMSSLIAIGGGLGPTAASVVYDLTGTYTLFIYAAVILTLFASALLFTLGPKPAEFVAKRAAQAA